MSNLVIVEHDNNEFAAATLHAITAAQQIGGDIDLLIVGEGCQAVADSAAQITGITTVKIAAACLVLLGVYLVSKKPKPGKITD